VWLGHYENKTGLKVTKYTSKVSADEVSYFSTKYRSVHPVSAMSVKKLTADKSGKTRSNSFRSGEVSSYSTPSPASSLIHPHTGSHDIQKMGSLKVCHHTVQIPLDNGKNSKRSKTPSTGSPLKCSCLASPPHKHALRQLVVHSTPILPSLVSGHPELVHPFLSTFSAGEGSLVRIAR